MVEDKTINRRALLVKHLSSSDDLKKVHLLFISASERRRFAEARKRFKQRWLSYTAEKQSSLHQRDQQLHAEQQKLQKETEALQRDRQHFGEVRLRLAGLSHAADDPFGIDLQDVHLDVHSGEIVGIAGVSGNGQRQLLYAISGEEPLAEKFPVQVLGTEAGRMTPDQRRRLGMGFVPEERLGRGAVPRMSLADNALLNYSGGRELELMGRHRVTVSHCPVNIARRARYLDSWPKYRAAGVNLALGSDTYPRDLIMQMRIASYFGKVMSHNLFAASAAEVFEAATLGGARALGRDDLGRLAPGAKADIVVIDLATRDTLRFGPVRDPIKALVECGIGDDVVTVIVDGVVRMRDRVIPGVDLDAVRRAAQDAGERVWERVQEWDPLGRTAEQVSAWSFPVVKD